MEIKNIKFITSVADDKKYMSLDFSAPEICVVGRSNVGKSSFINMLAGAKVAITSSEPGRTRLINIFSVNDGLFDIVDLPGYGFAKAPKKERERWGTMIEGYLIGSERLRQVFVLVDIRHDPTALDKSMLTYLYHYRLPFTVIATKADKLSKAAVAKSIMNISSVLGVGRDDIIAVSALSRAGKDAVLDRIDKIISVK